MPYASRYCLGCGIRYRPTKGDQKFHNRSCGALNAARVHRSTKRKTHQDAQRELIDAQVAEQAQRPTVERPAVTSSWWVTVKPGQQTAEAYRQLPRMRVQDKTHAAREL